MGGDALHPDVERPFPLSISFFSFFEVSYAVSAFWRARFDWDRCRL